MDRDRDEAGRARNARPRDAAGRPLPRSVTGAPRTPDRPDLTPAQALVEADRLLTAGLPFQAHDVLEGLWKQRRAAGAEDTAMWQGLAQLCVGLTHLQRGNRAAAVTLLRRAADNLGVFQAALPHGIDVAAVAHWARAAAAALETGLELPARPRLG